MMVVVVGAFVVWTGGVWGLGEGISLEGISFVVLVVVSGRLGGVIVLE